MAQINIHVTPEFEKAIAQLMRKRGIRTKSEAIRIAIHEALERTRRARGATDFREWVGLAKAAPVNQRPRFKSDADLWRDDGR